MAFHKRGGQQRMYKKPGRTSPRKQYQKFLRESHPLKPKAGGSTHEPA